MPRRSRLTTVVSSVCLLGALFVGANLAGLTGHTQARSQKAPAGPIGTLAFSDWQFPDTLNPYQTTLAVSQEVMNGMFDHLFIYNNKAQLVPQMAQVMPTVKNGGILNGGKTIVIHLKKGLRWSNGAPITAADLKFSWQVGMDSATGPACAGSCDAISSIATAGRYTAIFHLKQVYAPALPYAVNGFSLWPHVWAGAWNNSPHAAAAKLAQDPTFNFEGPNYPTNGAYQVSEFTKDNRIVLQPMRYSKSAHVQNLIFSFYSSKPGMMVGAANGETDVTQDYTAADLSALRQHTNKYALHVDPSFTFEHLEFNVDQTYGGSRNPLADAKVRQALALALDKTGLIRSALTVNAQQAKSVIAWTPLVNTPQLVQPFAATHIKGQWDPIAHRYTAAPGKGTALGHARKLLAETPWKHGFTLDVMTTLGNPVRQAQVAVLQANWARLGVQVRPNFIPASKLFAGWDQGGTLDHGQYQVAMFAFLGSPDPDQLKYNLQGRFVDRTAHTHAAINQNYSGIRDSVLNRAFNEAAGTVSGTARARHYAAAQAQLNKQAYWVPLYFRPTIATADSRVGNFSMNPTQTGPTWNLSAWKAERAS
jgi:peptide/nickel transport system substrate-binding protein